MLRSLSASVVICTMNRPDALNKCLGSLASQTVPPTEVIIVHAGTDGRLREKLLRDFPTAPFTIRYVRSRPSLVLQRNLGFDHSVGDVVFFLDDDVVLEPLYLECVLAVYRADEAGEIGGVQGSMVNVPPAVSGSGWLRRLFLLTRSGKRGYIQRSGFPCHSPTVAEPTDVEVFSGCMMSFRRNRLLKQRFDEALEHYWWGDDWDLSYRISREARLVQVPDARLAHEQAEAGRDDFRRGWRMMVVNHYYLYAKHLRAAGQTWLPWLWGEAGFLLLAVLRGLTGRGFGAARGMLEGFVELGAGATAAKRQADSTATGVRASDESN